MAHYNPFHNDEYQLGVILLLCFNNQTHIDHDIQTQLDDLINQTTTADNLLLNIIYKLLTQNNIPLEEDLFSNIDELSNLQECIQIIRDFFKKLEDIKLEQVVQEKQQAITLMQQE